MEQIITTDHVNWDNVIADPILLKHPIKSWITESDLYDDTGEEEGSVKQAKNVANLPFLFKHLAWMADGHEGYGAPIGAVIVTDHVVIPNAVGVDIGCGMAAYQLPLTLRITSGEYRDIKREIKRRIPVGFSHQSVAGARAMRDKGICLPFIDSGSPVTGSIEENIIYKQLGTLGGGNHFIELQEDDNDGPWIMVHSGSRNIGLKVAGHYNKVAKVLNAKWYSSVPAKHDLAFLPMATVEARLYMQEMNWCLAFANLNRAIMINIVTEIVEDVTGSAIPQSGIIDVHHNYAAMENHFGKNVLVHRKGATSAKEGQYVVIPGSMGSMSFIGLGRGNKDSFNSCSHGAGRKMGRGVAKRTLDLREEREILDSQHIAHDMNTVDQLDEATGAYKDIVEVMDNQTDLLDITHVLRPRAVVKDTSKKRRRY